MPLKTVFKEKIINDVELHSFSWGHMNIEQVMFCLAYLYFKIVKYTNFGKIFFCNRLGVFFSNVLAIQRF